MLPQTIRVLVVETGRPTSCVRASLVENSSGESVYDSRFVKTVGDALRGVNQWEPRWIPDILILDGLPHAAEEIGHLVALQDAFDRLPMLVVHPEGQRCPLEILQRRPCDRVESCLSVEGLTPRLLRQAICCAIHYGRCEQLLDALRKNVIVHGVPTRVVPAGTPRQQADNWHLGQGNSACQAAPPARIFLNSCVSRARDWS